MDIYSLDPPHGDSARNLKHTIQIISDVEKIVLST